MDELAPLREALDRAEKRVSFWWRDDDAGRDHPALTRLLRISASTGIPLALAIVPAWLEPSVVEQVRPLRLVSVLQHGWNHADHALPGERKVELGGLGDRPWLVDRLCAGSEILARSFETKSLSVLVPPWNRIADDVLAAVDDLGYGGFSAWPSLAGEALPGSVVRRDAQIDPISWRGGTNYVGMAALAGAVATVINQSKSRPIGLMSHHLVFCEQLFADWQTLLTLLQNHPNSRFLTAEAVFQGVE